MGTGAKAAGSAERRVPGLREVCQIGYGILVDLLNRAGQRAVLDQIEGLETVDDVLRRKPEIVGMLLETAWQLRGEGKLRTLFYHSRTRELVQERTDPIGPCGRTFEQVIQAHLWGAGRLHFDHLERKWAAKEAKSAAKAWAKREEEKRRSLSGRLIGGVKELAFDQPDFNPNRFRSLYDGYGLYDRMKPYLRHAWQFRLIPSYAALRPRQVEALDELLVYFRTPEELERVGRLKSADIAQAKWFARCFAEAHLGISRNPQRHAVEDDPEARAAKLDALQAEERRTFEDLLTRHLPSMDYLKEAGGGAETIIRRLAPHFGDDLWPLFQDPKALDNAVNCPDFILSALGSSARAVPAKIALILSQIQDRRLTEDLLKLAVEFFPREELERHLADPERKAIWNSLPTKFNNNYRYQADATDSTSNVKNFDNLRMVSTGIFESLRSGRVNQYVFGA